MSRITLTTPDQEFAARVRRALGAEANGNLVQWPAGADRADAAAAIAAEGTDVVAIGPDIEFETLLNLARSFDRDHPEISVLLVAPPSPELFEEAMRVGVREVIAPDSDEGVIREALDRAAEAARRRNRTVPGEPEEPEDGNRVIQVISPKGGVGKTTIATNLGVGLTRAAPGEVALVDLDLQFGDVANALRLIPEHTSYDVARAGESVNSTMLKVFLTPHSSGMYVLCAPESPVEAEDITPDHVGKIVESLRQDFRFVVVDTGSGLDEPALVAAEHATDLVLVCSTDVPTVRGLMKEIEALDVMGMTQQRRHVVLNRSDARVGLSHKEIESTIGRSIDVAVPSSRALPLATNQGIVHLEAEDRSPAVEPLLDLTERFVELPVGVRPQRSSIWPFGRKS